MKESHQQSLHMNKLLDAGNQVGHVTVSSKRSPRLVTAIEDMTHAIDNLSCEVNRLIDDLRMVSRPETAVNIGARADSSVQPGGECVQQLRDLTGRLTTLETIVFAARRSLDTVSEDD